MNFFDLNQPFYYGLLTIGGLILLPWWLLKLWQSLHAIANAPKPAPPPKFDIHKVDAMVSVWFRGPILFTVGGLFTFLGFSGTIYFRNPQYLWLIVVGSLFLSGLFFHTYFLVFSGKERSIFSRNSPGNLLVYTHPDWIFQNRFFALFGFANIVAGLIAGYVNDDIYWVLLTIYGLVFLLHLWSFSQLNILTISDTTLHFHAGLPANRILTIPLHTIADVQHSQTLYQKVFRIHTINIIDHSGAKLTLYTRLPHLYITTLT